MMLIKAESSARNGNYQDAIAILNTLRKKRFTPSDYKDLTSSNKEDALKLILDERRRELFGRGYRWFDQKRLNKESAYAETVTRVFKGVTYTLVPNDNHYVYAIAEKYINLNPEIEQNPR
jgi:starch-binding outer membrane protein, SusD/RagB family